jgi:hypothetical protein
VTPRQAPGGDPFQPPRKKKATQPDPFA